MNNSFSIDISLSNLDSDKDAASSYVNKSDVGEWRPIEESFQEEAQYWRNELKAIEKSYGLSNGIDIANQEVLKDSVTYNTFNQINKDPKIEE